jgi:NAD(P)-dependent dehydrogenase (short-subunit alcohol dehydrogenase family)
VIDSIQFHLRLFSRSIRFSLGRLQLIAHLRNQGRDPSNRLLDIGVKWAAGRLLNSSYPARSAFCRHYDYAQTKAATMNYVKSLAKQLGPKGIRVNGAAPGPIWTPLQVSGGASQEKLKKFGGQTSLGRPGQPAELASIYVQLAANDASFATGQVYRSAGGSGQP